MAKKVLHKLSGLLFGLMKGWPRTPIRWQHPMDIPETRIIRIRI